MAQGTEIGPEGKLPIGVVPQPAGGPLISYTRDTMYSAAKILPPCESEVIPLPHIVVSQKHNVVPLKRGPISLESRRKRALPASIPLHEP
jgi:hypothetical protein